jgi:hypothetical protein
MNLKRKLKAFGDHYQILTNMHPTVWPIPAHVKLLRVSFKMGLWRIRYGSLVFKTAGWSRRVRRLGRRGATTRML